MSRDLRTAAAAMLMALAFIGLPSAGHSAGALAVGACGAYGYAFDFSDATKATRVAIARCKGKDCKLAVTMKRTCAAFAIDAANVCGAHGFATAKRLAKAQNTALEHCYKFGGKDCVVRAFACDAKG
jgi:hypothetical protein